MAEEDAEKAVEITETPSQEPAQLPPRLPTPEEQSWSATDLLANRPFIICILYLCTYFTVFSCVVGVVLAHVFIEGQTEDWERTQFQYLIRTFWMMIGAFLIALFCAVSILMQQGEDGFVFAAILGGLVAVGVVILAAARTVFAMLNAVRRKPMPRPRTLLI